MSNCIFCKIANSEISTDLVLATPDVVAFKDINPKAPVHVLAVPKKHISSVNDAVPADAELLGKLMLAAKDVAAKMDVAKSGYRLIVNCGRDAGQVVDHLHLHVLGGKAFGKKGEEM